MGNLECKQTLKEWPLMRNVSSPIATMVAMVAMVAMVYFNMAASS